MDALEFRCMNALRRRPVGLSTAFVRQWPYYTHVRVSECIVALVGNERKKAEFVLELIRMRARAVEIFSIQRQHCAEENFAIFQPRICERIFKMKYRRIP